MFELHWYEYNPFSPFLAFSWLWFILTIGILIYPVGRILSRIGFSPLWVPDGQVGIRSRQLLLAILGTAQQTNSRAAILQLLYSLLRGTGELGQATEELTPTSGDPLAALPVIAAVVATLAKPSLWRRFHSGAVGPYALTPDAWDAIVAAADQA